MSGNVWKAVPETVQSPHNKFAIPYLLSNLTADVTNPMTYQKAFNEALFLLLTICWIITYLNDPEKIRNNPLKERLGYYDLCVGLDTPPAVYVAGTLWGVCSYLGLRLFVLDYIRFTLSNEVDSISTAFIVFKVVSTILMVVATLTFPLIFLVSPWDSVWVHSGAFMATVIARYFSVLSMYIEFPEEYEIKDKVYMFFLTVSSISFPILIIHEYRYFDAHGIKSPLSPWICGAADYTWFLCMGISSKFLPDKVSMYRKYELLNPTDAS